MRYRPKPLEVVLAGAFLAIFAVQSGGQADKAADAGASGLIARVEALESQARIDRATISKQSKRIATLEEDLKKATASGLKIETLTVTVYQSDAKMKAIENNPPVIGGPKPPRQAFATKLGANGLPTVIEFPLKVDFKGKPIAAWHAPLFGNDQLAKAGGYCHSYIQQDGKVTFNVSTLPGNMDFFTVIVYILYRDEP
jgi:hypothetical protein